MAMARWVRLDPKAPWYRRLLLWWYGDYDEIYIRADQVQQ